jgi:cysteine-rich CWC protein
MGAANNPNVCPSCGEPNACGLSQGKSECWCFSVKIEPEALARIPSKAKDQTCICARCAATAKSETGAPAPDA